MELATQHQKNTGVGLKSDDHRAPLIHVQGGRRADRRELEAQVGRRTLRRTKPLPAALRLRSLACASPRQRKMPRPKPARARSCATSSSLSSPARLGASAVALATACGSSPFRDLAARAISRPSPSPRNAASPLPIDDHATPIPTITTAIAPPDVHTPLPSLGDATGTVPGATPTPTPTAAAPKAYPSRRSHPA